MSRNFELAALANSTYAALVSAVKEKPLFVALCTGASVAASTWVISDYLDWKSFGTGGTPSNFGGYLKQTVFRIIFAPRTPYLHDTSSFSTDGPSHLSQVPRRKGQPRIMPRILPHRQRPEYVEPETAQRLLNLVDKLAAEKPDVVENKLSKTEGRTTDGLYARKDVKTVLPAARHPIIDHEIAHAHHSDHSLHVWLSDRDAKKVVDAGWGERFPLPVPNGWIMVYAPRDEAEMDLVENIVRAAASYITGVSFMKE